MLITNRGFFIEVITGNKVTYCGSVLKDKTYISFETTDFNEAHETVGTTNEEKCQHILLAHLEKCQIEKKIIGGKLSVNERRMGFSSR